MKDWGFSILKGNQIDLDRNDTSLANAIAAIEPSFRWCIGCGSCSATCTAAQFVDYNPRRVKLLIARGETALLRKEIAKCMLCGKCQLVCPRDVNTRKIVQNLKRMLQ